MSLVDRRPSRTCEVTLDSEDGREVANGPFVQDREQPVQRCAVVELGGGSGRQRPHPLHDLTADTQHTNHVDDLARVQQNVGRLVLSRGEDGVDRRRCRTVLGIFTAAECGHINDRLPRLDGQVFAAEQREVQLVQPDIVVSQTVDLDRLTQDPVGFVPVTLENESHRQVAGRDREPTPVTHLAGVDGRPPGGLDRSRRIGGHENVGEVQQTDRA